MEIYEYDYDGIKLDIHYHTEDGDESVGMFGMQVYVEGVYHKGEDITDLIGKSTYEFLESELYEALNGWYFKRLVSRSLLLCHPTNCVGYSYRWLMREIIKC